MMMPFNINHYLVLLQLDFYSVTLCDPSGILAPLIYFNKKYKNARNFIFQVLDVFYLQENLFLSSKLATFPICYSPSQHLISIFHSSLSIHLSYLSIYISSAQLIIHITCLLSLHRSFIRSRTRFVFLTVLYPVPRQLPLHNICPISIC